MNIAHFDVDKEIDSYITGKKYEDSLQDLSERHSFESIEGITIKSVSNATKETLKRFPKLKLLITRTVGTDHIDLDYCKAHHIAVYHIEDYGSFNIAEHMFALLLTGTRNIIHSQKDINQGVFSYKSHLGVALKGKTLGVVGTGKIGIEVIKRAIAFEMHIVAYDVFKNEKAAQEYGFDYIPLDELARISDIITLHAPLLESTKHMINEELINTMKDEVILINTARGGLIDTDALIKKAEKFRWIGLDVLEDEQHFSKEHLLLTLPNVVITPHIAFFSDESVKKIAEETKKLVENFKNEIKEGRVV